MGNDASRITAQAHSGGRRIKLNVDSTYAEEYKVFEGVLVDPTELFSLFDARGKGVVDVLEVFASAFLFAAGTRAGLEAKLDKLFSLFDFDGSASLNDVEAEMMIECVVRGALDTGELTVRDIKGWVFEREDVLAYLCGFTEARMIISSLQLVEESIARGMDMSMQAAAQGEGDASTVDGVTAGEVLRSLTVLGDTEVCVRPGTEASTDADVAATVRMLTGGAENSGIGDEKANLVKLDVLKEFLRFWVAFSVVDEEGVGRVNVEDLKALLWLAGGAGGEEPPEASVQKTVDEIDESRDGIIERMEWIRYTAVLDEGTGSLGFDRGLMNVFRRYDDDRSGSITASEMSMMVRDSVMEAVAEAPGKCSLRPDMEGVVETLVTDIARDLVTVMDVAGSGVLGWTEFKKNQNLVATRLATLRDFVLSAALQRDPADASSEPGRDDSGG
eukprot:jgi/Undpi1/2485/HiC_scaffold_13.g05864.m1